LEKLYIHYLWTVNGYKKGSVQNGENIP